ncbi:MAG: hydantoinase/oxoprolinase family protein [Solirubrobacterales bacterium]|nr:hydantoinase/oxoprolinase family protein [Solirubrobacterales bacterium]
MTAPAHAEITNTISIDIGGTFTDCFACFNGASASGKALTTRHRLTVGFDQAIAQCAEKLEVDTDTLLANTDLVRYATTLAMNALLERKGPRLALFTTAGFEDTIYIGRGAQWHEGLPMERKRQVARGQRPEPLIRRHLVMGLRERIDDDGTVIIPLDPDDVRHQLKRAVDEGAMGFVVALMQSHRNPAHEQMVRDIILEEYPEIFLGSQPVLLSSEVLPRANEYQRDMTTILAAYLHRTMAEELTELGNSLNEQGYRHPLFIVNSSGGANPLQRTSAVETYNAGPVAGVMGGAHVASVYGLENVILSDMGGTSFDIGTVVNIGTDGGAGHGRHFYALMPLIDRFRVGISMIETKSIGAGGGSIARFNERLNIVEVGPDSAGSNPGPAAFDLGGEQPTVTDADVVLGYIDPDYFLGGSIRLNPEASAESIRRVLAEPLGVSVEEAAYYVKSIIDAKMGNEIFKETNLKGYDPREFTLFAYGGAGGAHASGFGSFIEARQIMTFPFASVFSAFGIANTDFTRSYERDEALLIYRGSTQEWTSDFERFNATVLALQTEALRDARELGGDQATFSLDVFMRYSLQRHVLRIRSPRLSIGSVEDLKEIYRTYESEYARLFGRSATFLAGGVEILGFALWSTVRTTKVPLPTLPLSGPDPSAAFMGHRRTFWGADRGWLEAAVYDESRLAPGNRVEGPAIVEAPDTTIVIDPDRRLVVDERGSSVIETRR